MDSAESALLAVSGSDIVLIAVPVAATEPTLRAIRQRHFGARRHRMYHKTQAGRQRSAAQNLPHCGQVRLPLPLPLRFGVAPEGCWPPVLSAVKLGRSST